MGLVYDDEVRAKIVRERGYLVMGTFIRYRPGEITRFCADAWPQRPYLILSETDQRDHEEQCMLVGDLPYGSDNVWPLFYRVMTD
jgi:hypothetical protein